MDIIQNYTEGLINCIEEIRKQNIEKVADIIYEAYKKGKQIFIMGNGGSASTASHFALNLSTVTREKKNPGLRVNSLTDNVALITALANDIDYSSVFKEQLVGRLDEGDVVIGISASGNSPNVLKAIEYAQSKHAITIGFIGCGGGKLKSMVHSSVILSSSDYGQVEDIHLSLVHMISSLIKDKIR